jgi:DNA-directed RNA polymerase omega subunit
MQVFTPGSVARHTGSKYLGVLVAAKYARRLNELRRGELMEDPAIATAPREKLTTTAAAEVASGALQYRLEDRRTGDLD